MKNYSKKDCFLTLCLTVSGAVFGILSKSGDVAVQGDILGNILHAFGSVSSGFFIWVVICTGISVLSKNRFLAAVNILVFLIFMLLSYYLYSYFIVEYLVLRIVKFWIVMLIPSAALGSIVWNLKTNSALKYIVLAAGTLIFIFDVITGGQLIIAIPMYAILYGAFLTMVIAKRRK